MEADTKRLEIIIHKLSHGMRFGLYENGESCYFADGKKVNYQDLWAAIRIIKQLTPGHGKALVHLYPVQFMGTFPYKFSRYKLKRLLLISLFHLKEQKHMHGYLPHMPVP